MDNEAEALFLKDFPDARLKVLSETPQMGPDGWPYLLVAVDPEGAEPAAKVLHWLSDKGIGLVVNPDKQTPDYVFTYGMIWNFRERGEFLSPVVANKPASDGQSFENILFEKSVELSGGQKILAGAPSESFLPIYVREVLRAFFKDNEVGEMRVLVMGPNQEQFDFCFSMEALGSPSGQEHRGILEAISWFLPAHYSLMLVSEKDLPKFHNL